MSKRRDDIFTIGAAVSLFAVYAFFAPSGLLGADQGEYATLAGSPGIAHPPGYPLYTAFLRLLSPLPGLTVVHSTAVATAALGSVAMAIYFRAMRAWGLGAVASLGATLLVGLDYTVWSAHSHAEALAMSHVFVASILWAAAPGAPSGTARAALLGLFGGLGLASHQTIVFLAPLGLWALWRALDEAGRRSTAILALVATTIVGLSPYLYLLFTPTDCIDCLSWGSPDTMSELWRHVSRADYGATSLTIDGAVDPIAHWLAFGERFVAGSVGIVPVLTVAGIAAAWRANRTLCLTLGASFFLAAVVFVGMMNTPTEGMLGYTTARFFVVPIMLTPPLVASALDYPSLSGRLRRLIIAGGVLALILVNSGKILADHRGVIDAWTRDTLLPLPDDAIIVGTGDHRTFSIAYAQYVEGIRPDVDWIDGQLLAYDWYVDRLDRRLQTSLPRTVDGIPLTEVTVELMKLDRPIYFVDPLTSDIESLPSYPYGPLLRVLPPGAPLPEPARLARGNADLFAKLELQRAPPELRNPWERDLLRLYRRPWESLAGAFHQQGNPEAARRAELMAEQYSTLENSGARR